MAASSETILGGLQLSYRWADNKKLVPSADKDMGELSNTIPYVILHGGPCLGLDLIDPRSSYVSFSSDVSGWTEDLGV